MKLSYIFLIPALCLLALVGCQPQITSPDQLPTMMDLNALSTQTAEVGTIATQTAAANLPPTRPPLPATWTPSPEVTPTPSETPPAPPTAAFDLRGTIYYIHNNDRIRAVSADIALDEDLPIPQTGSEISHLGASPNGRFLSYIAPGSGSAREVWVFDLLTRTASQVSRLGWARIAEPVWRPDSQALAFFAAQTPDGPLDAFVVNVDGSGGRQVSQLADGGLRDLSWGETGAALFFQSGAIYAVDVATSTLYPLATDTSINPFFAVVHHPTRPELVFLRVEPDRRYNEVSTALYRMNTAQLNATLPRARDSWLAGAQRLRFSDDGRFLLIATDSAVIVRDWELGGTTQVAASTLFPPQPVISPDSERVAFVNATGENRSIPQIFVVNRRGGETQPITTHTEGTVTVSDLVWVKNFAPQ